MLTNIITRPLKGWKLSALKNACFMKISFATLLIILAPFPLLAQDAPAQSSVTAGFELDVLPYATGGYFGAFWAGQGHWRGRLIVARATKPDFLLPDDYTDNAIRAYALLADYFPKQNFRGWWLAAGVVYWDARIQYKPDQRTGEYQSYLLSGGLGYNWKFYRNFYLSPWVGGHIRVAGDNSVVFTGATYHPPRFNPEGSVKLGWHF